MTCEAGEKRVGPTGAPAMDHYDQSPLTCSSGVPVDVESEKVCEQDG